ncbi:zinc finger and BTB domain-containing protein 24 [Hyalella azteca]|uniref:Zinc finger and BTB domain-containing protein 24 n=1 Tax=Hyalella azteca TaxID=294128 RepID=A0A979FXM1_HYAAZ|nr:zinc finger and BTB domain-containing protein 24 [Hyalella azteca]
MVMADPQLHLRWHSHSSTFTAMLSELHDRAAFSDLTIICDDGQVNAHKAVLSLCSPYLSKLLSDITASSTSTTTGTNSLHSTTLILPEIPVRDITYLVSFIYCGQVDVPQTHISSFLNTGKHLHVLGLEQGDRLVESPEPSEGAGSWCDGDGGASEDDTVTSSSLPLSRSSTPQSGGPQPPNAPLAADAHMQQIHEDQQAALQQQFSGHDTQLFTKESLKVPQKSMQDSQKVLSQQQLQLSQQQLLRKQLHTSQAQLFAQQETSQLTSIGHKEATERRLGDVNANVTSVKGRDSADQRSLTAATCLRLKQEAADEEQRDAMLTPQISIKEERMCEREDDEETQQEHQQTHLLDLKHSLFSSVTNNGNNSDASNSFSAQHNSSSPNAACSSSNSSCSSTTDSAAVAAAALASIAGSDSGYSNNDVAPASLGSIIGRDGRIDLNFYLQQAIQYASMPCPLCKKEFKSQSGLRDHIRLHTGERPFICDFCHMNFARASHLKRHRRMHTGEKPFDCRVCGKDFSRGDKLKDHLKRHEADEKLNKIRKQLLNPEDCASSGEVGLQEGDQTKQSPGGELPTNEDYSKQFISNGDLACANMAASTAGMVLKLASTAVAAGSGAVDDSLNQLGERVANLTARANPQAVTPDSVMSAKTSVSAAAVVQQRHLQQQQQQQRLLQQQQQTYLHQQISRRPASSVNLSLQPSKKRKIASTSSSALSSLPLMTSSSSSPLFTSSSFSDLVNVASAISNGTNSSSAALLSLMTSNANSTNVFSSSTSLSNMDSTNSDAASTSSSVIPQMLAMANIGECVLKPIN